MALLLVAATAAAGSLTACTTAVTGTPSAGLAGSPGTIRGDPRDAENPGTVGQQHARDADGNPVDFGVD